jgi:hypothetical protein
MNKKNKLAKDIILFFLSKRELSEKASPRGHK